MEIVYSGWCSTIKMVPFLLDWLEKEIVTDYYPYSLSALGKDLIKKIIRSLMYNTECIKREWELNQGFW
jgi:hypothetical protein